MKNSGKPIKRGSSASKLPKGGQGKTSNTKPPGCKSSK